jgi:GNAT superfamily N-acetyltransferase
VTITARVVAAAGAGPLKRMRRRVVRRERMGLYGVDAAAIDAWPLPDVPGVTIRDAVPGDAEGLADLLEPSDLSDRFARGDVALVAEEDGVPVGCTFVTSADITAPHYCIPVRPGPGEAYGFGLAVRETHRRRGIGVALFREARRVARDRGVTTVESHVQFANTGAIQLQRAAGGVLRRRMYGIVLGDRVGILLRSRPVGRPQGGRRRELMAAVQRSRRQVIRRVRYDRFDFYPGAAIPSAKPPPGVEIRHATGADLPGMRERFPAYMRPMFANLASRPSGPDGIKEGHRGWVAVADGEVIACVWVTSGPLTLKHLAIRVVPGPGEWYGYGVHIRSGWKGSLALGFALQAATLRDAGGEGVQRITSHIDAGNRFNRIAHRIGGVRGERTTAALFLSRWAVRLNRVPTPQAT